MSTDWKAYAEKATFTLDLDGVTFLCARPSGAQLVARGVLPPALVLSQLDKNTAQMNGDRNRVLLDEKAQDALLDAVLIEPKIHDGPFDKCPEGSVPRRALAGVRDVLVIAILSQLYDVDVVRGAAFRDREGAGGNAGAVLEAGGDAGDGSPGAAGGSTRRGTRARSGRAAGA